MPLLEDKILHESDQATLAHFEETFKTLLERYTAYQQQIIDLTKENKKLKTLLQEAVCSGDMPTDKKVLSLVNRNALLDQINEQIKIIDRCLTYFTSVQD